MVKKASMDLKQTGCVCVLLLVIVGLMVYSIFFDRDAENFRGRRRPNMKILSDIRVNLRRVVGIIDVRNRKYPSGPMGFEKFVEDYHTIGLLKEYESLRMGSYNPKILLRRLNFLIKALQKNPNLSEQKGLIPKLVKFRNEIANSM